MKKSGLLVPAIVIIVLAATRSFADCPENAVCVTSFTISPGEIEGDQTEVATGTVTVRLPPGTTGWNFFIGPANGPEFVNCIPPAKFAGTRACLVEGASTSASVLLKGINSTPNVLVGSVKAWADPDHDTGIITNLLVDPIAGAVPPPLQSDTTCPDCGFGAQPINFTTGNTYIPQQDYSIPGLAGGLSLNRTWNSLWPSMQPVQQVGLFGDSWTSNFEERIQSLAGGTVQYWKGDGSRLFYQYDSFSGTYSLTAPLNDQTTLSFNSGASQWTILFKDGTQKIFNIAGYLISVVDRNGNTVTINVDAANQNRISSVVDAAGRALTFHYDNAQFTRLCTSITDAIGTAATYDYYYDSTLRLKSIAYPDGSHYNFAYNDVNGATLISSITDSQSRVLENHTYDGQRRGLMSEQASHVNQVLIATNGYDTAPGSTSFYDSLGHPSVLNFSTIGQRNYSHLSQGHGCASCGVRLPELKFLYSSGYVAQQSDQFQNKPIYFSYDSQGNATTIASLFSNYQPGVTWSTWNYTYNSFGEVLTATDPLAASPLDPNHTTTYEYYTQGNLKKITSPLPDPTTAASVTQFTYFSNGSLKTITDPLGHLTQFLYYPNGVLGAGQIQSIKDANNKVTTYTYDARGNRLTIQDPFNGPTKLTTFTYDSMNRLKTITYPSQTTSVTFHYDWRGRRDWVQDQNGNKTIYGYDDADRLTSVTDAQSPTAGVTTYVYDTENNLTDVYDAAQNHTHMDYNASGWLSLITFPSSLTEQYLQYDDSSGNLLSKTDRNGNNIHYDYDLQNRLKAKNYPDSTSVQYNYDVAGRLYQVTDPSGTYSFSYDNMNRLTQADVDYSVEVDSAGTLTVKYGYDAASNRTSMTDPQNLQTVYTPDNLNRLHTLAFNGQTPFQFDYDALSRRTSLTRPNGINTTYGYDPASRLLSIMHKLGTTGVDGATYTYDDVGNRLTRTDKRTNITLSYTPYDNIYQLQMVKQGATTKESYTYDLVGNRLSSLGVSPYVYNSSNELTSTPTATYGYDNNGNRTSKTEGSNVTHYYWEDFENRLTKVELPSGGGTVTFKYDPFGRRIQKSSASGTTDYVYDGVNVLEEVDTNGAMLARYTQGQGVDEPLAMLRGGVTSYYEPDGLGSITSLTNGSGTIAKTYSYDPFGKLVSQTGTLTNPFQYTARESDSETGIYEYRARYYDQGIGRFISEDPLQFYGNGTNFYTYVANQPVLNVDPTGLRHWGPLGGRCCNSSSNYEWWINDGVWNKLPPGECTGFGDDCDGMTCGGGFYYISNFEGGRCQTPGKDCDWFARRRWTPTHQGPNAEPPGRPFPGYTGPHPGRGGPIGNPPPPGYTWGN